MRYKVTKQFFIKLFLGCLGLFIFMVGILNGFSMTGFVSIYVLILSLHLVWISRKNCLFLIMFATLAYSNYSIAFSEYTVIKSNTLFTRYAGTYTAAVGIYIMLLFWSLFVLVLPDSIPDFTASEYKNYWRVESKNQVQFMYAIALNIVLILIWVYGFTKPEVAGERGSPSAIYEYSTILFILCYYFTGEFKSMKISTTIILVLYALQNFIYGGRITGLQLLIIFYIMCMEERFSIRTILPFVIGLFLVFSIIGTYRGNWLRADFSLSGIWEVLKESMFTLDTAYSSYHTSLTFLLYADNVDFAERMRVFGNFLKAIFLGGYGTPENSVAHLTVKYYAHYYGGVLPFFFYFYMGWSGVAIIVLYVNAIIRLLAKAFKKPTGLKKCLLVYFVASAFRWYLYSPIQLTRGMLLMAVLYTVSKVGIQTLNRRRIQKASCII